MAPAKTFVLVHGAFHGGWCWTRVAACLEARGHKVYALTLTGLGERSHLLSDRIDLATHIADVVNFTKWRDLREIVLCGHSYGGHVISGAAEHIRSRIASIVFLDAIVPQQGDSVVELSSRMEAAVRQAAESRKIAIPAVSAAAFQVNERDRGWVDGLCTPHPIRTFTDKIALTGEYERIARKVYVRAMRYENDMFDAAFNRVRTDQSWLKYELDCGHDAMVDLPQEVSEILDAP